MQEHLDQLVFGPALPPRHAQVDSQFGGTAGRRVGDDTIFGMSAISVIRATSGELRRVPVR